MRLRGPRPLNRFVATPCGGQGASPAPFPEGFRWGSPCSGGCWNPGTSFFFFLMESRVFRQRTGVDQSLCHQQSPNTPGRRTGPPCPGRASRLPRPPLAERGRPSAAEPRPRLPCFLSSPVASWSERRFSASESAGPHTPWGPEAVVSPCAGHRPQHLAVCHLFTSFEFLASCSMRHCALLTLPRCEQRSVHGCVETCSVPSKVRHRNPREGAGQAETSGRGPWAHGSAEPHPPNLLWR